MASQKLATVKITANATTAKKVIEEIDNLITKYTNDVNRLVAANQQNSAECKKAEAMLRALSSAQKDNLADTKRLGQVVQDLANTKLRDLRRAMGSGKSALAKLTGSPQDLQRAKQIRQEMKLVGDQIRILEGQYVKIPNAIGKIKSKSDEWLSKAINQQKTLVSSLSRTDASYNTQLATLKKLEAEEDRRRGKMGINQAMGVAKNTNATAADLRRAQTAIVAARDNTSATDTKKLAAYNGALAEVEKRLQAVQGKEKQTEIGWKQMKAVLSAPDKASGQDIKRTMDVIQQKMQQLPAGSKRVAELRKQYEMLDKTLKGTRMSQQALNDILNRAKKGKATIDELKRAYKQLEEQLQHIKTNDAGFKQKQQQMQNLKKQIDAVTGAANKQSSAFKTTLQNLTAYVGVFAMFNKVKSMITGVIQKNLQLSDQLANIRKVSNLAYEDINKLSRSLAKIDTRTTVQELNNIAYAGAKLGMGNYGIEGLESFVRASNKVNVALKEDLGEDALTALSKFTEVMGLIPKLGVEQSMLKVGSAMFKLASTSTATAGNIVEFSKRLTGIARTAGITADQILALGSASDSMMLMPEVASTAFNKLITSLQRAPGAIEKSLQMPEGRINDLFKAGNAMEAIVEILSAMKAKGNMHALNSVFKDLGSDGARLIAVMVTMAKNVDMLKTHLATANEAYEDGSAVTKEYIIQQETAQALLERANNMWTKAFVNPEGVDSVKEMAKAWYDMSKYLTENAVAMNSLHAVIEIVIASVKTLIAILPGLMAGLVVKGAVAFWSALSGAFAVAGARVLGLAAAWRTMNLAMKANWISLAIGLVVELGMWLTELGKKAEKVKVKWDTFTMSLKEAHSAIAKGTIELNHYKTAIDQAAKGTEQRRAAIANFNKKFGSYLSQLITEKSTVQELAKAYDEASRAIEKKILLQFREKDIEKHVAPRVGWAADRLYEYDQQMNSLGLGAYGGKWLKSFDNDYIRKHGVESAVNELISKSGVGGGVNDMARKGLMQAIRNGQTSGSYDWTFEEQRGRSHYTEKRTSQMTEREKAVAMGVAYLRQQAAAIKAQQDIQKKYGMYDLDSMVENDLGDLTGNNNGNGSGLKPLGPERPETEEDPLTKAKKQLMEMRKNIMAFYEQQMSFLKEQMAAEGTFDPETAEVMLKPVEQQMYEAINALESTFVLGGNAWKEFNGKMGDHLKDAESFGLLNTIQNTDVDAIRELANEGRPKGYKAEKGLVSWINKKGKETTGRGIVGWQSKGFKPEDDKELFLASTLYDSSRQENKRADISLKQSQKRLKDLLEHDYTGKVQQESVSGLLLDGFATSSVETFEKDKAHIVDVLEKSRSEIVDILAKKGDREGILKILGIDDKDSVFKPLLAMGEQDFDTFYRKLIQYSDQYTEAQKKEYEEAKRVADFAWKLQQLEDSQKKRKDSADRKKNMFPDQHGFGSRLGFAEQKYNPEIEEYKLKVQFAKEYYDFVKANSENTRLQQEAELAVLQAQNELTEKMVKAMQERMEKVKQFAQPIVDFGSAAGEALAQFSDDVDSAQKAMKNAVKSMLKSWGEMMINDLTSQMMQGMKNGMSAKVVKKNEKKPDVASTVTEGVTDGLTDAIDPTSPEAMAEQTLEVEDWKYEKMLELESAYQEMSLEQWKEYYAQKMAASGAAPAEGGDGGSSPLDKQAEQNEALLEQQQEQNKAMINLHNIGQSAANAAIKKGLNLQFKIRKKANKDAEKDDAKTKDAMVDNAEQTEEQKTDIIDAGATVQMAAQTALNTKVLTASKAANAERVQGDAATTEAETTLSIVEAMAKCFSFLGPIAGPIMAGVVQALLMGLLQWGLSKALGGGSDSKKADTAKGPNTKLVSGMLTYDQGNVRDLKPFFDKDGNMYWATEDNDRNHDGINLLTKPTATTINGQPSLVAEQGPELVIGRETTAAMMQNNPALLKALYQYDKHHSGRTAYDRGNLSEFASAGNLPDASAAGTATALADATASNVALLAAVNALLQRLNEPIKASINMYGRDGLYESNKKAQAFMKNK